MLKEAGLAAVELDFTIAYPTALFAKPVLCVQDYVASIGAYMAKGTAHAPLTTTATVIS